MEQTFFSTDEAFSDVSDYIEILKALELSEEEKDNILYNNIFRAYNKLNINVN